MAIVLFDTKQESNIFLLICLGRIGEEGSEPEKPEESEK